VSLKHSLVARNKLEILKTVYEGEQYVFLEVEDWDFDENIPVIRARGFLTWLNGLWFPNRADVKSYTISLCPDNDSR
jgi:hypothetical protein